MTIPKLIHKVRRKDKVRAGSVECLSQDAVMERIEALASGPVTTADHHCFIPVPTDVDCGESEERESPQEKQLRFSDVSIRLYETTTYDVAPQTGTSEPKEEPKNEAASSFFASPLVVCGGDTTMPTPPSLTFSWDGKKTLDWKYSDADHGALPIQDFEDHHRRDTAGLGIKRSRTRTPLPRDFAERYRRAVRCGEDPFKLYKANAFSRSNNVSAGSGCTGGGAGISLADCMFEVCAAYKAAIKSPAKTSSYGGNATASGLEESALLERTRTRRRRLSTSTLPCWSYAF